ncbi:hypothetical protein Q4R51_16920 [Morganella morganii]|uniref:hypothetical protein n=1 Tax=Morganella morganii TaxID=582 RepID=UPI001BD9AFE0|nr:hypothetical protein [Morganella morganii]EKU4000827.1 hypothetical protein [Morganella morganii]MBT0405139.1 hypothetical protein [Morganella morganii subsp. morganii]
MSIETELAYLKSGKRKVLEFIDCTPPGDVICLMSWNSQLDKLNKEISELEEQQRLAK